MSYHGAVLARLSCDERVLEGGVANDQDVSFEKVGECCGVDVPSAARAFSDTILVVFPVYELIVELASDVEQCVEECRDVSRASSEKNSSCSALLMLTCCVVGPYTLIVVNRELLNYLGLLRFFLTIGCGLGGQIFNFPLECSTTS